MAVVHLTPNRNLAPTAETLAIALEGLAQDIRSGEVTADRVVCILDSGNAPVLQVYGKPESNAYVVGVLEYTKTGITRG